MSKLSRMGILMLVEIDLKALCLLESGIVMSMSLFRFFDGGLALVAGYEDGYVKLWRIKEEAGKQAWPWELVWSERKHLESG